MTIARPSSGEIIASAWGDAVADALNALNVTTFAGVGRPWGAAWGQLAYAQTVTPQNGIGTAEVDLTGLAVSVTPPAGRRLRVSMSVRFFTSSTGIIGAQINVNGTNIQEFTFAAANNGFLMVSPTTLLNSTGVAMAIKGRAAITSGTINTAPSNPGLPMFLLVEDIGPV